MSWGKDDWNQILKINLKEYTVTAQMDSKIVETLRIIIFIQLFDG